MGDYWPGCEPKKKVEPLKAGPEKSWGSILKAAREQRDAIARILENGSPSERNTLLYRAGIVEGMKLTAYHLLDDGDIYNDEFERIKAEIEHAINHENEMRAEILRRETVWNDAENKGASSIPDSQL